MSDPEATRAPEKRETMSKLNALIARLRAILKL